MVSGAAAVFLSAARPRCSASRSRWLAEGFVVCFHFSLFLSFFLFPFSFGSKFTTIHLPSLLISSTSWHPAEILFPPPLKSRSTCLVNSPPFLALLVNKNHLPFHIPNHNHPSPSFSHDSNNKPHPHSTLHFENNEVSEGNEEEVKKKWEKMKRNLGKSIVQWAGNESSPPFIHRTWRTRGQPSPK